MERITTRRPHAVHISTVHDSRDPRIRLKQLRSIAAAGWRVSFLTGDVSAADGGDGISIHRTRSTRGSRWRRIVLDAPQAMIAAAHLRGDVYHIHDPELLPWTWLLRSRGAPVIYDVHEDYVRSIEQKEYLPSYSRRIIAASFGVVERTLARLTIPVLAERAYSRRFPNGLLILNYPLRSSVTDRPACDPYSRRILYTGNVTVDRGALQVAELARYCSDISIELVGRCDPAVTAEMRRVATTEGWSRLRITGENRYVPHDEIAAKYTEQWLAGIALFPDTPHYRDKELTKFFEYMASGLPIIATRTPAWQDLIEGNGVGICVDANDPRDIQRALESLRADPNATLQMGLRGQDLIRTSANWESQAEALVKLYDRLLRRGL